MKRRRSKPALSEHQQLFLAIVLVILLAVSVLYCIGFSSVAVRHLLETTVEPESTPDLDEEIELAPVVTPTLTLPPATPL